jgi:hypothetical protein
MENKTSREQKTVATDVCLINSINKFESALHYMKSTVLVPMRLKDIECEKVFENRIKKISNSNGNLYNVYTELNRVRNVLYGHKNNTHKNHVK